tara:strand:+ start:56 stop:220 length:165 start_codon:yes stop_codon:yes gene_type:complete
MKFLQGAIVLVALFASAEAIKIDEDRHSKGDSDTKKIEKAMKKFAAKHEEIANR